MSEEEPMCPEDEMEPPSSSSNTPDNTHLSIEQRPSRAERQTCLTQSRLTTLRRYDWRFPDLTRARKEWCGALQELQYSYILLEGENHALRQSQEELNDRFRKMHSELPAIRSLNPAALIPGDCYTTPFYSS